MLRRLVWGLAALLLALAAPIARATDGDGAALDPAAAVKLSQSVIGASVGDYAFRDRAGQRVLLSSYRGKPLLVSFVYSGCFQVCPVTTRMLANAVASAQRALGAGSFNVITIGFNVPFDTPQAMADFATRQGVALPNWEFLSVDDREGAARVHGLRSGVRPVSFQLHGVDRNCHRAQHFRRGAAVPFQGVAAQPQAARCLAA